MYVTFYLTREFYKNNKKKTSFLTTKKPNYNNSNKTEPKVFSDIRGQ